LRGTLDLATSGQLMAGRLAPVVRRVCILALGAVLSVLPSGARGLGTLSDRPALARALAEQLGGSVEASDWVWARSSGVVADYFLGRLLFFLGAPGSQHPRALYASCARLTPDGKLLGFGVPRRLSPIGGEALSHLIASGDHAAFLGQQASSVWISLLQLPASIARCNPWQPVWPRQETVHRYRFSPTHRTLTFTISASELTLKLGPSVAKRVRLPTADPADVLVGPVEPDSKPVSRHSLRVGAVEVQLVTIAWDKFAWRLLPGKSEPFRGERPALTPVEATRAMIAITLGSTSDGTRYGFATRGTVQLPLRAGYASLKSRAGQAFEYLPMGKRLDLLADEELVQLPMLLKLGELTANARSRGALRERGALCLAPPKTERKLFLAYVNQDSNLALAQALTELGCSFAFELDRGSQDNSRVFLRDGQTPLTFPEETSTLVGLE